MTLWQRFPPLCTRLLFVVNTLTVFLSFCYIYEDFVWQLKAFPASFCHFCACEMWGHLITQKDPSVGYLNGILARVGGNLKNNFKKSQMHVGLLGGGGWSFNLTDTLCPLLYAQASCTNYMQLMVALISPLATLIIPSVPCHSRPLQWLSRGWSLTNYTIHGCCSGH